jgi:hypothetical protein
MVAFNCKCRKGARCLPCIEADGLIRSASAAARTIHVLSDRGNRDPRFLASVVKKVRGK